METHHHHHHDSHEAEAHRVEALEQFRVFLKANGLSITKNREMVLNAIYSREGHFTVDELEDALKIKMKGSHRATIYRTIKHMMEAGLLAKVQTSSHTKVAYEHTLGHTHHDHLVCDRCGDIIEFHNDDIEKMQEKIAENFGFEILHHSLVITGVCTTCKKSKNRSPSNVIVRVD